MLHLLTIMTGRHPEFRGRREVLLASIALLFLYACRSGTELRGTEPCGTNCWTTKASMLTPRADLGVGVVNGVLYAVGGYNTDYLGVVEAYDPAANSWTTKASMPTPRAYLGVGVVKGVVYAVGGLYNAAIALGVVEAYDPVADTWTTKASMPTPREFLGVGVVNGVLYAVGGIRTLSNATQGANEAYQP